MAEKLDRAGYPAVALNGDMNQQQRERTIDQMKSGKASILIATDVVARGLDIARISLVVNYDLPGDNEAYVHRIGRTGRAGREGTAISFVRPREMYSLRHYERLTSGKVNSYELPSIQEIGKARIERTRVEMAALVEKIGDGLGGMAFPPTGTGGGGGGSVIDDEEPTIIINMRCLTTTEKHATSINLRTRYPT